MIVTEIKISLDFFGLLVAKNRYVNTNYQHAINIMIFVKQVKSSSKVVLKADLFSCDLITITSVSIMLDCLKIC